MKFGSFAVAITLAASANAFAPVAPAGRVATPAAAGRVATTELNLFGLNTLKAKAFNKPAKVGAEAATEAEVRSLFELWNQALATGDSRIVASRYAAEPVLLATVSDQPRTDFDSVKDYFDAFLLKQPQGKILDGKVTIGNGFASDAGIYEVS